MVYSSDFYTTRRPYTRPISSSYTISPLYLTPSYIPTYSTLQVRTYPTVYPTIYPPMPYVAHKRLVTYIHSPISTLYHASVPVPIRIYSRLRPSIIKAELNRIRNRLRPSSISYTEQYLNSKDNITFDDEAKDIRAQADSLRRRINIFVPRHIPSDYAEVIVPERMRSDDYVHRLLTARKNDKKDVTDDFPWYRTHMGDGNLACVKYVGGRPQSRRRPYYTLADCIPGDVKNDVNLLSYYLKNRQAAANASKGWRDRVPELYAEPSKSEKKEEDGDPTEQEE